jgi:carbon monoxide dehydrogenase subunit G
LENSFEVSAALDRAWALLNDVPRVVPCMPGAELIETVGDDSWKGLVHVRLGPIALDFDTDVVRESMDASAHRVVLATKARERRGRGAAQATIESTLTEVDGATSVLIVTDVSLQGAVAQYGRGVVPEVAARLTRDFAGNLAQLLAADEVRSAGGEPSAADVAAAPTPATSSVKPVSGIRLGLRALWMSLARRLGRR